MFDEITNKKDELAALCRKHHVRHLAVFGSAIRDDFDPARSDIDFRVEFAEVPIEQYATNYFGLLSALEGLFARTVDLLSARTIENKYLRREIESTQETLYAA
jgi:predicted nucleotidyltransferase